MGVFTDSVHGVMCSVCMSCRVGVRGCTVQCRRQVTVVVRRAPVSRGVLRVSICPCCRTSTCALSARGLLAGWRSAISEDCAFTCSLHTTATTSGGGRLDQSSGAIGRSSGGSPATTFVIAMRQSTVWITSWGSPLTS